MTEPTEENAVSLSAELGCIATATEAARTFADRLREYPEEQQRGLSQLIAVLSLIGSRVQLIRSAVRGENDPAILRAAHNSAPEEIAEGDDPDMRLSPWTPEQKLQHLLEESERLRRQASAEAGGDGE